MLRDADMEGYDDFSERLPGHCSSYTGKLVYALREPQGWRKVHWPYAKMLYDFWGGD